jgi:putative tricarboxylic transport membrane protein
VFESITFGFGVAMQPANLFACFVGVFVGTLIGVLPGIGPVATMSLLLPVTFAMSPTAAIIMMAGIYYGAMYGGSTTSILVNIPGEAASVITCLDGYRMARQGRAGAALGISAFASFIAGTVSVIGIMVLAPPLARLALGFGPPEIFALLLIGFTMVTWLASGSRLKAAAMALLGLFLGTIGLDPMTATPRFTYGTITLSDGIGLVPMIMGIFGVAEVLLNIEQGIRQEVFRPKIHGLLPTRQDWKDSASPIARGSVLGFFLGILPGLGAIIPTFIAYAVEKRISRHPERFGTGIIEGVAAPEAANNAASAGAMVPMLTLGIPGSATTAVMLGGLMMWGLRPGPLLFEKNPDFVWGLIASLYIANVLLLVLNIGFIPLFVRALKIPYAILMPLIIVFCITGAYSLNNKAWDVGQMLLFGVIGYGMKKLDYSPAALTLALVLGQLAERSLRQSMIISDSGLLIFVTRPIAAVLTVLALAAVALPIVQGLRRWRLARAT